MEGRRGIAFAGGMLAAAMMLVAGCGEASNTSERVAASALAQMFAPAMDVEPHRSAQPISPSDFLAASTLRWSDPNCGGKAFAAGAEVGKPRLPRLETARLAGRQAPYVYRRRDLPPSCEAGEKFATSDYTRPYDPLRANDIAIEEGFYLDLDDNRRRGRVAGLTDVPAYLTTKPERYRGKPALRLTYWMLFTSRAREGAWERVSVLVRHVGGDRYAPVSLRIYDEAKRARYEEHVDDVPWSKLLRVAAAGGRRTHPLVVAPSADGAMRPARRPCQTCQRWQTWRNLDRAAAQPWYGFGGGWGYAPRSGGAVAGLAPSAWNDVKPFELD